MPNPVVTVIYRISMARGPTSRTVLCKVRILFQSFAGRRPHFGSCTGQQLTKKAISIHCPTSWRRNGGHRYGTKKLRHCHPTYMYSYMCYPHPRHPRRSLYNPTSASALRHEDRSARRPRPTASFDPLIAYNVVATEWTKKVSCCIGGFNFVQCGPI